MREYLFIFSVIHFLMRNAEIYEEQMHDTALLVEDHDDLYAGEPVIH